MDPDLHQNVTDPQHWLQVEVASLNDKGLPEENKFVSLTWNSFCEGMFSLKTFTIHSWEYIS